MKTTVYSSLAQLAAACHAAGHNATSAELEQAAGAETATGSLHAFAATVGVEVTAHVHQPRNGKGPASVSLHWERGANEFEIDLSMTDPLFALLLNNPEREFEDDGAGGRESFTTVTPEGGVPHEG